MNSAGTDGVVDISASKNKFELGVANNEDVRRKIGLMLNSVVFYSPMAL